MKKVYLITFLSIVFACIGFNTSAQNDIVITEIMYNPPESGTDSLEFIEIYNKGEGTIDLSG